jgi:hypothetical protein
MACSKLEIATVYETASPVAVVSKIKWGQAGPIVAPNVACTRSDPFDPDAT